MYCHFGMIRSRPPLVHPVKRTPLTPFFPPLVPSPPPRASCSLRLSLACACCVPPIIPISVSFPAPAPPPERDNPPPERDAPPLPPHSLFLVRVCKHNVQTSQVLQEIHVANAQRLQHLKNKQQVWPRKMHLACTHMCCVPLSLTTVAAVA